MEAPLLPIWLPSTSFFASNDCGPRLCRFYLDAGSGIGYRANSNQFWMVENYAGRGLPLDRAIFFEAKTVSGARVCVCLRGSGGCRSVFVGQLCGAAAAASVAAGRGLGAQEGDTPDGVCKTMRHSRYFCPFNPLFHRIHTRTHALAHFRTSRIDALPMTRSLAYDLATHRRGAVQGRAARVVPGVPVLQHAGARVARGRTQLAQHGHPPGAAGGLRER